MASGIFNRFKSNLMKKAVNLETDTIKVALYNNSYSFNASNHTYSTTNELATANGYTQGGKTLSAKSVTEGATTKWDADDVSWATSTFTAYHGVIYDSTASNSLICSFDFGGAQSVTGGTFTIQWNGEGIITLA